MFKPFRALALQVALWASLVITAGCTDSPSPPTGPGRLPDPLAVMSVAPQQGLSGTAVTVTGTGFLPGATVALDGLPAIVISTGGTTSIRMITPVHAAGAVDVVVTNPGGQSERLNGGFTYEVVILTASPNVVISGEKLQVSWVVPPGRSSLDWIGLFKLGEPNLNYLEYVYTNGATSGTVTFIAPAEPGQYDFRYLLNDDYMDIARSNPVTVNALKRYLPPR